jgi:hypothetical protein
MRYVFFIFLLYSVVSVWAQVDVFLGLTAQNDFLNYRGHGTDRYYTVWHQVALLFYKAPAKFTHHQISVTQQLYTPDNLQDTALRFFDYPYAGLLFTSYLIQHRPLSSKTRMSFSSTCGYSGRRSGARQAQQFLHRAIGDEIPLGWDHIVENGFFSQFKFLLGQPLLTSSKAALLGAQSIEVGTLFQRVRWGLTFILGSTEMSLGSFAFYSNGKIPSAKISLAVFATPTFTRIFKNHLLQWPKYRRSDEQRVMSEQMAGLEFGLQLRVKKTHVHFVQYLQQREFQQASPHAFGEVGVVLPLFYKIQ